MFSLTITAFIYMYIYNILYMQYIHKFEYMNISYVYQNIPVTYFFDLLNNSQFEIPK